MIVVSIYRLMFQRSAAWQRFQILEVIILPKIGTTDCILPWRAFEVHGARKNTLLGEKVHVLFRGTFLWQEEPSDRWCPVPPEWAVLTWPTSLLATPVLVVHGLRIPPSHKTLHVGIFQWTCSIAFIRDPAQWQSSKPAIFRICCFHGFWEGK